MKISNKYSVYLLASAVALTAFLIYIQTLKSGFIWDDIAWLSHPLKLSENPLRHFLGGGGLYYRPLTYISLGVDFGFHHLDPLGYHVTNIVLHVMASLVVFLTAFYMMNPADMGDPAAGSRRQMTGAFIAGMVFAIHPIHTESVAWISARTDILCTLLFLLAFLAFMIYERDQRLQALLLSAVFFLFSLFSKESAVSFMIIVPAYCLLRHMPAKRVLVSFAVIASVLIAYFTLRNAGIFHMMLTPPGDKAAFFSPSITLANFIPLMSGALGYYVEKLVVPFHLNLMPDIPTRPVYFLISVLPFVFGALMYFSGLRTETFLIAWVIATLSPSVFILFSQVAVPLGERYLYLPSVGFSILAGILFVKIKDRRVASLLFISFFIVLSLATIYRLRDWRDDASLWEKTVKDSPGSIGAHANYGRALLERKEMEKGKNELLIALKQTNITSDQASNIYEMLGTAEMNEANFQKAESYFMSALQTNPRNAAGYNNFGYLCLNKAESAATEEESKELIGTAIKSLKKALEINSNFIQPRFNLGLCYLKAKDYEEAKKYFRSVIESDPRSKLASDSIRLLLITEFAKRNANKNI